MNSSSDFSAFPGLSYTFNFEKNFDSRPHLKWFNDNWTLSIIYSTVYCGFLIVGTEYMRNRKPFNLRLPLGLWSLSLAVFSLMASIRIVPEYIDSISRKGIVHSFCYKDFTKDPRIEFWMILFVHSKAIELGDTVFVVLRKQKLIFLHWFHHVLTLIFSYFCMFEFSGPFRWFSAMNLIIHTVMYSYYSLKAFRFYVPPTVSIMITSSQILQMILGFMICIYLFVNRLFRWRKCDFSFGSNIFGLVVYTSFLILFLNFFVQSYLKKNLPKSQPQENGNLKSKDQ